MTRKQQTTMVGRWKSNNCLPVRLVATRLVLLLLVALLLQLVEICTGFNPRHRRPIDGVFETTRIVLSSSRSTCTKSSTTGNNNLSPLFVTRKKHVASTSTSVSSSSSSSSSETKTPHLDNDANLSTVTVNNPTWDQNIAALLEYEELHGTVNLPAQSKDYPNLSLWVRHLRQQEGRLAHEQKDQLNKIGFSWKGAHVDKKDRQWIQKFRELEEYKAVHGHCIVPYKQGSLGRWVQTQRRLYTTGNIQSDRQEMLESIGFVWRLRQFSKKNNPEKEARWNDRFRDLCKFKQEHGHTHVPRGYPKDEALSWWVHKQRVMNRMGSLRPDRKEKLDAIGFTWDFDEIWEASWLDQYEQVKICYEKNLSLSQELRDWLKGQRRFHAKGSLPPERVAMLEDIGIEWFE